MNRPTSPIAIFFLVLPYGISGGFALVTLPFVLTQAGLSVETAASIVAIGVSAYVWAFLWGPVVDLTLTLRRWYLIGVGVSAVMILVLSHVPMRETALVTGVVFVSQVAVTLIVLPVGGLMAHTVVEEQKGRAAGWYQAGNLGGGGLGGGAGVWLASHRSPEMAGLVLSAMMVACGAAVFLVPDVRTTTTERLVERLRLVGRDFLEMVRSPVALLVIALVMSPIGAGAAASIFSAAARDWSASADTVAVITGILSGAVSIVGCTMGGWFADRIGRWWAFFGAGTAMALVAIGIAAAPRTPLAYGAGVLSYAFSTGLAYAAYSALVLLAVGRGAASTKYAILSSLGNIPCAYMAAFDGWAHDRWGAGGMMIAEAILSFASIALGLAAVAVLGARTSLVPVAPLAEISD